MSRHGIEAHFLPGIRLHDRGRLQEAEQVYNQVLAVAPGHADALHMLGVLALQCGQPKAALACIDQAITAKPKAAIYHVNRAGALLALHQLEAAHQACQIQWLLQQANPRLPNTPPRDAPKRPR
jgi:tetratricopeptide (TPR) repeat protein